MLKIEVITDLTDEPVSLEDVKAMLRITGNGHNAALLSMITMARKYLEGVLNKSLGEKTLKLTSDDEYDTYNLPYGPNQVITDEDEDDDGNYVYTYTTGYETVPDDIKMLLMEVIKYWFDIDDIGAELPKSIQNLIAVNTTTPML